MPLVDRFIVIHYNELGLKKGNRDYFENRLCSNINADPGRIAARTRVQRISGRILLHVEVRTPMFRRSRNGFPACLASLISPRPGRPASRSRRWSRTPGSLIEGRTFDFLSNRGAPRRQDFSTHICGNQSASRRVRQGTIAGAGGSGACGTDVLDRDRRKVCLIYVERTPGPGGLPVGNERQGRCAAVRRNRFAGRGMEDDQARLHGGLRSLPQLSLHEQGIAGEGEADRAAAVALSAAVEDLPGAVCGGAAPHHGRHAGGDARHSLPPVHDAACGTNRAIARRRACW